MTSKIGRNDKCPCGSGLKYKKCCLLNGGTVRCKTVDPLDFFSKSTKIVNEDGNGFYRVFWDDKIEKVNPIEYYKNFELSKRAISYRDTIEMKNPYLATRLTSDYYIKFAKEQIEEEKFWENKENVIVPENFLKLFETSKKKEQVSLLKGLSINPDQLISLIFKSYTDYGFLYSRYRFEILPKDLNVLKKPKAAEILENGAIKTVGETDLTSGQIKKMIEHSKVIIAHIFDKEDTWHCLFITYHSINGKENHKDGQPHFHYISSAFGIPRDEFIDSMKNGNYKSTSVHIDLLEYGNQPKTI